MCLDVRLIVGLSRSLLLTFALWVTFDIQQPRLEPCSQYSFLAIKILLRHISAYERCMGFFVNVCVYECVFICVCLCTQTGLPFKANGGSCVFISTLWSCARAVRFLDFKANNRCTRLVYILPLLCI